MANNCPELTRDYIVLSAIIILRDTVQKREFIPEEDEFKKVFQIMSPFSLQSVDEHQILKSWNGQTVSKAEKTVLFSIRWRAEKAAKDAKQDTVTADLVLGMILKDETPGIKMLYKEGESHPAEKKTMEKKIKQEENMQTVASGSEKTEKETDKKGINSKFDIISLIHQAKELQSVLQKTVLGQEYAVSAFVSNYFQSELQAVIEKKRTRPLSTFLFAGPPGVGKTYLSEQAAEALGLPFRRFDMSEYSGPNATDELSGSDANYKGSAEGLLTSFVAQNPRCLVLFDEIEKALLEVIHLFLQVLDAGRLRDNRTDKEISFKDTILIFTTNAGKQLYESSAGQELSSMPREVVLDALAKDINPKTREPYFPAAICSRFASGNVIMFHQLGAHTLLDIVETRLREHAQGFQDATGISMEITPDVSTAILLAEGASADARRVKSRADAFFGGELFELYRLLASNENTKLAEAISKVKIFVDLTRIIAPAAKLFSPSERIHALVYSRRKLEAFSDDPLTPILHDISTPKEAKKLIGKENIQMVLCDLFEDGNDTQEQFLNREDISTPARDFLFDILSRYPSLPVLLIEYADRRYTEEEKYSFIRRGVRAFIQGDGPAFGDQIRRYSSIVFQQNNLEELARSNQVIHFETAQRISDQGNQADIILFDIQTVKSIKAEDTDNVLSMFSIPDVRFNDVIGADDAKNELKYFVKYMKDPKRYRGRGAPAPKGLLLYGPPGTGKTMLAKAFAAESGATFLATEGSQFFKGVVGQGPALVRRLFAAARRYAPSVLFIDEIDTIARARSGRDTDMGQDTEQILTTFFSEMDGFKTDPSRPVFVLGATNYSAEQDGPMSLDPAMLRRFDRRILIDLPNRDNRYSFLTTQFKNIQQFKISPHILNSLVERSAGMSLAQLSSILDMALRDAVRNDADQITDDMMEEAFEKFNGGDKKQWNAETVLRIARHEAGHTVINWLSGESPSFVTIVSRGNYGGYMRHADQEERFGYTRKEVLSQITTALGGRAAEILYYGEEDGISTGASGDLKTATTLAQKMICTFGMVEKYGMAFVDVAGQGMTEKIQETVNGLLKQQLEKAIEILSAHRNQIDRMVDELLQRNSLKKEDIDKIMEN